MKDASDPCRMYINITNLSPEPSWALTAEETEEMTGILNRLTVYRRLNWEEETALVKNGPGTQYELLAEYESGEMVRIAVDGDVIYITTCVSSGAEDAGSIENERVEENESVAGNESAKAWIGDADSIEEYVRYFCSLQERYGYAQEG